MTERGDDLPLEHEQPKQCNHVLAQAGAPYPRLCAVCGEGPCTKLPAPPPVRNQVVTDRVTVYEGGCHLCQSREMPMWRLFGTVPRHVIRICDACLHEIENDIANIRGQEE